MSTKIVNNFYQSRNMLLRKNKGQLFH